MKKIRLIPLAALIVAIMFSAFTTKPLKASGDDENWYYTESIPDYQGNQLYYVLLNGQAGSCGAGPGVRCVIIAPDDGGYPDLSGDVEEVSFKP